MHTRLPVFVLASLLFSACGGTDSESEAVPDTYADEPDIVALLDVESEDLVEDLWTKPDDLETTTDVEPSTDASGEPNCSDPPGGFGCDCTDNDDCDGGFCVPWDEGYVCTRTCLTDCPEGWECRAAPQFVPDIIFVCWPGASFLCRPCDEDDDCGGGTCLELEDGPRCTRPCDPEARPCPTGHTCADAQNGTDDETSMQCIPTTNACDCGPWTEEANLTRPCRNEGDVGTCWGEQTCDPDVGWADCSASQPATESCNGKDDDCNGIIDDVEGRGQVCETQNEYGNCEGIRDCDDVGQELVCSAATPDAETCNGMDDDCDGEIDQTFSDKDDPCIVGQGQCERVGRIVCLEDGTGTVCNVEPGADDTESCNGLDDDCDGDTDEDFADLGGVCLVGQGSCERFGVYVCADDALGIACSVEAGEGMEEDCNGLDDDCDGETDEELTPPLCRLQDGVCAESVQECAGALGWLACDDFRYPGTYQRVENICDTLDNDCDGNTDEVDLDSDGHRPVACGGDDCDDTNPLAYPGADEICGDTVDNDCSGIAEDRDADNDGVIAAACGGLDCNDESDRARPGLDEVCGDSLDNDCDGSIDNRDIDHDHFFDFACGGADCDDSRGNVYPGAEELCDGLDNDCNGETDDRDIDGDGYLDSDPLCGGDDCDDDVFDVNPAGVEQCGNDIDEDCSGAIDDRDIDQDGAIDANPLCGGDDCNDEDPRAYPGGIESYDLLDNDCNGEVDEWLIPEGSVVICEIMAATTSVDQDAGQYIELYNAWHLPVNLAGWAVAVGADAASPIETTDSLVVASQDVAVLCLNDDPETNGGVVCDGRLTNIPFDGDTDRLTLSHAGTLVDYVSYGAVSTFPNPLGHSLTLAPTAFSAEANDLGGNWCEASEDDVLPEGDFGTPGVVNPPCSPAPTIDAIEPDNGTDVGGFLVLINGNGFRGATDVRLGEASCVDWAVVSDTEIQCWTAPHLADDVDVVVDKGVDQGLLEAGYRYTGVYTPNITWACSGRRPTQPVYADPGVESPYVYGEVRWSGHTGDDGSHTGIVAEVGYGQYGTHPRFTDGWQWFGAGSYYRPYYDNDEYRTRLTIPDAGTYSYVFRFSEDGGLNWEYSDFEPGTADGFELGDMGRIIVD